MLFYALVGGMPTRAAFENPAARAFAEAYEMEWARGDLERAVGLYRVAQERAGEEQREIAAAALYRLGLCEARLGQEKAAARIWEEVVDTYGGTAAALAARDRLTTWRLEVAMVTVSGRVVRADGTPASGAWVMAGEGGQAPLLRADKEGRFVAECRLREEPAELGRYLLVYAEDAFGEEGGLAVVEVDLGQHTEALVPLTRLTAVRGHVVDVEGQPIPAADIGITGVLETSGRFPFAYARFLEPVRSDADGRFLIEGILPSVRLQLTAKRDGYRLKTVGEWTSAAGSKDVTIVLERLGRGWIEGRVTDERGRSLEAIVSAWTMPPERQEVRETRTGPDGRYRLDFLPEQPLWLEVQSTEGYATRRVAGVWGGGANVDVVLARGAPVRKEAEPGAPAPEVDAMVVRGPALRPPAAGGDVTLLCFWARDLMAEPPPVLQEWYRKYGGRGLRVICVHDHSGMAEDLVRLGDRLGLGYTLAVDRYGPAVDTEARNSLTFARYGAVPGSFAVVDAEGRLMGCPLRSDETEEVVRQALTAWAAKAANRVQEKNALVPGMRSPDWRIRRWIRGGTELGSVVEAGAHRGRVMVVRLGSVYADSFLQSGAETEHVLDQILRAYGEAGVGCAWILPAGEVGTDTEELALRLCREALIGVDHDGVTFRAYGVGPYTENWVIDVDGNVFARCADNQLARTVKMLLRRRGLLRAVN